MSEGRSSFVRYRGLVAVQPGEVSGILRRAVSLASLPTFAFGRFTPIPDDKEDF